MIAEVLAVVAAASPVILIALIVGLMCRMCLVVLRLAAWADELPPITTIREEPPASCTSTIDRLAEHRKFWIDALLCASEPLLEDGDPAWRPINEAGMRAFDAFIQEFPYDMAHSLWIDHVTIRAALQSSRWTITVGGERQ